MWTILIIAVILIAAYFIIYYLTMRNVNEPAYKLISKQGNIERRDYAPMLIAEVTESGNRDTAINQGFRQLANYIFGNNREINSQQSKKIAMTAPVIQTPDKNNNWHIRFVMPKNYTLETLPKPNNSAINVYQQPAIEAIVIRFSGKITDKNIEQHLTELESYLKENQIETTGEPIYAFYNPPWTLPAMRRNEILFTISANPVAERVTR